MSIKVMTAVFDRYPNGGGEMLLALALADHASDDGTRIYPSVKALAEKTRQSERTVQYQLRRMQEAGWLILVNAGNGGRGMASEYRISSDWLKGAEIAPFQKGAIDDEKGAIDDTKGCNPRHKRVQPIAPTNNRHRTVIEPSGTVNLTAGGETPTEQAEAKKSDEPKFMVINDAHGNEHHIPLELRYPGEQAKTHRAWTAYAIAYQKRYGVWPIWNASIGGRMSQLVDRVGQELAPKVAYHYVAKVEDNLVLKDMHSVALLLSGAEKWATQLRAGIKTPIAAPAAVNKQEALEARNRRVGEEWERKMRAQMAQNGG